MTIKNGGKVECRKEAKVGKVTCKWLILLSLAHSLSWLCSRGRPHSQKCTVRQISERKPISVSPVNQKVRVNHREERAREGDPLLLSVNPAKSQVHPWVARVRTDLEQKAEPLENSAVLKPPPREGQTEGRPILSHVDC